MSVGLVGEKCGMTRVFTPAGDAIPVTVVKIPTNKVVDIKTAERNGYSALQVTAGEKAARKVNKPLSGVYRKADVAPGMGLWEFRIDQAQEAEFTIGQEVAIDLFADGQFVDVRAKSKGKGFQGGVKRHNFRTQDATHGNSLAHRAPGSIGQCQTPGRVFKGKKMAGQMGNVMVTTQSLQVVRVDKERGLLLIKGAVPGAPGGIVRITPSVKVKKAAAA